MTTFVQEHHEQLVDLCQKYGIKRLELCGSAARDDFDIASSDIDFVYEFDTAVNGELWDRY